MLFEAVTGTLDGLYAPDTQVVSDVAGVVATVDASNGRAVEKDAKMATVYSSDDMQIKMVISEADWAMFPSAGRRRSS
ncbi:MAG: HlyD family efflux transporter periplasmic adaptor subunit [Christensenellales bacterium]